MHRSIPSTVIIEITAINFHKQYGMKLQKNEFIKIIIKFNSLIINYFT